jgi:NADPH2:quinone reductase
MERPGAPDVLHVVEREAGPPAPGEALVRHALVGVNYIDVQQRTGRYPLPAYPAVLGMEACGIVEALGTDVETLRIGDRVAYASPPPGAYAERRCMPADRLVKVPDGIDDFSAGANLLRGLTAQYLLKGTCRIKAGDRILVHAAAGGVGLILCQWAKHLGAAVIGTAGSGPTFEGSLASLRPRGLMVSYGTAAAPVPPFDIFRLNRLGSLFLTSPSIFTYTRARDELVERADDFFAAIAAGAVRIEPGSRFALAEAAHAHAALEARATTGAVALIP